MMMEREGEREDHHHRPLILETFPYRLHHPPQSPALESTQCRERNERRREERRERDQSCEPSGSGTQRNDARRQADRERSPRESLRSNLPRRDKPKESDTPINPRVEKRALSDHKEHPTIRTHLKKRRVQNLEERKQEVERFGSKPKQAGRC